MKCIFCGEDSSYSKSVEHIIPESFGNKTAILPKGIVCDKCNNYFSRKVEGPFLDLETFQRLRQELELEKKNGKRITNYEYPKIGEGAVKQVSNELYLIYSNDNKSESELVRDVAEYKNYLECTDKALLAENKFTSRLLAKIAVEYFVYKCGNEFDVCDYVLTDEAFNSIRKYARYGSDKVWIYNARRIYARNKAYQGDPFRSINYEADFLFFANGEVYFVVFLHGIEYAINMSGSYIEGYKDWLKNNNWRSPLYLTSQEKVKMMMDYHRKISKTAEKIMIYDFNSKKGY